MLSQKVSIQDKILKLLLEPKYRYKGLPVSVLGLPAIFPYKRQSVHNAILKMKKEGFIIRDGADKIMVSSKGQTYIEKRLQRHPLFHSSFKKITPKDLLILFDIPEDRKAEREWLRSHLKFFGYDMVQKSIWLGPSPLPKPFLDYIKSIHLDNYIKTFRLAKAQKQSLKINK